MSEKVEFGFPHLSVETLQPYLLMASTALGSVKLLAGSQPQVVGIVDKVQAVINNPAFGELVVFLANTFGNTQPSKSELAQAVKEFGEKSAEGQTLLKSELL